MNGLDDADEIANMLRKIYGMANGGFAEIVSQYKNMKQMCSFFFLPYSTAQKWGSGERRVGEEGRTRWSPHHLKKKKK